MKILQFCHKSPFPPKEGGPIAINNITQGLIEAGHSVKVFAISTPKCKINHELLFSNYGIEWENYIKSTEFEYVYTNTSVSCIHAILNFFSKESYNISRFVSREVENKLIEILLNNDFDFVQLESLFVSPYVETIRKYSKAKIILRSHNIEFLVWERLGKVGSLLKRVYVNFLARKLKNYEISMLNKYDGIATITREDAEYKIKCGCDIPVTDIPFGVDINKYEVQSLNQKQEALNSIFFIGSMDWKPNQEGLRWFLKEVWEKVNKIDKLKFCKCYIAGRNFPDWLNNWKSENLEIIGEVEDAIKFISSNGIMIVPLFSGSGVRVKIIEGMALGKAIISTGIGAEGINYKEFSVMSHQSSVNKNISENIIIADTPKEWIDSIAYCIENNELCEQIGKNAKELIRKEHDNKLITQKLIEFYKELITTNS